MKFFLVSFFTALILLPQILFADVNPEIWGRWIAQNYLQSRGVQLQLAFDFSPTAAQMTANCYFSDGAALQASTYSYATYFNNEIYIQETRENATQDGYHFCRASLAPSTWSAYFDYSGRLVLYMPIPYQSQFFLVRTSYSLN